MPCHTMLPYCSPSPPFFLSAVAVILRPPSIFLSRPEALLLAEAHPGAGDVPGIDCLINTGDKHN